MVVVMALGGSTNAVLHLIAMARSVDVTLTIDDFQRSATACPLLADLKPCGKYVMEDLHSVGGTPAVMKYLLEHGLLDGDCTHRHRQDAGREPRRTARPHRRPADRAARSTSRSKPPATSASCAATSRPTARSPRSPARKGSRFTGPARVFDSEEDMLARPRSRGRFKRATSSSSATKAPRAAPACRKCSRPPAPSWAPGSAATSP